MPDSISINDQITRVSLDKKEDMREALRLKN
jgi:hypothetical protein